MKRWKFSLAISIAATVFLAAAAGWLAALPSAQAQELPPRAASVAARPVLWIFLAPGQGDLTAEFEALAKLASKRKDLAIKVGLLADSLEAVARPTRSFAANLKKLFELQGLHPGGIPLLDAAAAEMARALGIRRLPAYAYEEPPGLGGKRRIRVASGRGANLEELVR